MVTEQAFLELQAKVTALEKMHLSEWSEIKDEQINLSMRINALSMEVRNLLKEAQMLMGTLEEVQGGSAVYVPLETPNLKTIVDTLMKISKAMGDMQMSIAELQEQISLRQKD